MLYKTGLYLYPHALCMLIVSTSSLAAPGTPTPHVVSDTHLTENNAVLERFDDSYNRTNSWGYKCYTREQHPALARPVNILHCMASFYVLLKTAGADNPVRWNLYPPMSPDYIWRDVYKTCVITLRRRSPEAVDEFTLLSIAHQAAIVADHCLVTETLYLGGQTIVGSRGVFYVEVANFAVLQDAHTASSNSSATIA